MGTNILGAPLVYKLKKESIQTKKVEVILMIKLGVKNVLKRLTEEAKLSVPCVAPLTIKSVDKGGIPNIMLMVPGCVKTVIKTRWLGRRKISNMKRLINLMSLKKLSSVVQLRKWHV